MYFILAEATPSILAATGINYNIIGNLTCGQTALLELLYSQRDFHYHLGAVA